VFRWHGAALYTIVSQTFFGVTTKIIFHIPRNPLNCENVYRREEVDNGERSSVTAYIVRGEKTEIVFRVTCGTWHDI
jgi:hypothetical protein